MMNFSLKYYILDDAISQIITEIGEKIYTPLLYPLHFSTFVESEVDYSV